MSEKQARNHNCLRDASVVHWLCLLNLRAKKSKPACSKKEAYLVTFDFQGA